MAVHKVYAHFIILLCFHLPSYYVFATDTLIQGQSISLSDTIVSAGEVFELGFFSPGSSSNSYVGIWYRKIQTRTVVWVANRKFPITDSTATLTIRSDGNIAISFDQLYLMVTNVSSQGSTRAVLLDSGNLVLRDSNSDVLWESFDYPSHTFLPGMKIGIDKRRNKSWSLTSWRTTQDPGIGDFSLKLDSGASQQFSIMQGSKESWSSGSWSESAHIFSLVPEMRLNYLYFSYISNENESYFTYSLYNSSITSRCILDVSGQIKQLTMLESKTGWDLLWMQPKFSCDVSSVCGPFSVCSEKNYTTLPCECIQGFEPSSAQDWTEGRTFGGCVRKSTLQCHTGVAGGDKDKFLEMPHIQFPDNPQKSVARSVKECRSQCLRNCSCSAYAYNGDGCSLWIGSLYNTKLTDDGQIMCLKLASSELPATGSSGNKRLMLALVSGGAVFLILSFGFYLFYRWRKIRKQRGQNILLLDSSIKVSKNDSSGRKAPNPNRNDDSGLPLFSFSSVSAATDNFSLDNKLGEGGFGPVYKVTFELTIKINHPGKLLKGMSIAVKRLSTTSGQGLQELENEAKLIAKLQHKNLVKLLGCCLEKGEKILIYEFMPNKSLDSFLFDPYKQSLLDWDTRVTIIEGIAQGLLYLHQYSRLRIIHRDLKASNILLDADMNPKISDFGMARIFGGNQSQANTKHIVGTYGYMPPEYVLEGLFSIKSDVFSYGVLLLEILSGKRNTGFYKSNSLDLLGHAWELWNNGRARELADPILEEELSEATLIRYINIALLCVQENADDRPTMSEAVSMLINGATLLPSPKPPAFSNVRGVRNPNVDATAPEICSINGITISSVDGR